MTRKRLTEVNEGKKMNPEAHVEERKGQGEKEDDRERGENRKGGCLEGKKRILNRTPCCTQD